MAADPLDLATIDRVRPTLGGMFKDDALLQTYLTACSRMLDDRCGAIVQRTVTDELHDGGHESIWLRHPAAAFTTVIEAQGTTTVTLTRQTFGTAPAAGYLAKAHETGTAVFSGELVRMAGGARTRWYAGDETVKVTYTAGRYANTAAVDAKFVEALILCVKNVWRSEQAGVGNVGEYETPQSLFARFVLPNAVKELLYGELRTPGLA